MSEVLKTEYSASGKTVEVIRNGTETAVRVNGEIKSGLTTDSTFSEKQFQTYLRT